MKTIQKKTKLSKGEIREELQERQDLEVINSSGSYVNNIVSTPYGGFKARDSLKRIDIASIQNLEVYNQASYRSLLTNFQLNEEKQMILVTIPSYTGKLKEQDGVVIDLNQLIIYGEYGTSAQYDLKIYTAGEDEVYSLKVTETITSQQEIPPSGSPQNYSYDIGNGVWYVRISLKYVNDEGLGQDNIYLDIDEISMISAINNSAVKFAKFIFNNDQKYLLVLHDEAINVYQNDIFQETIDATGLLEEYFNRLKYTQSQDTMIFTHPDMSPKILQRSGLTWTFADLTMLNVPVYPFDGETKTQPAFTLTPSATEGAVTLTASGAVFGASAVGQIVDGGGGRVKITEADANPGIVYGYTIVSFYTTDAIASGAWDYITGYEAIWSVSRGYPNTCLFAKQRFWFGGSKSLPNSIVGSRLGDYFNFKNSGNYDNDSIFFTIDSSQIDEIVNIYHNRGIQVFTAGAEWIIPETTLTPKTISITKNTPNGSLDNIAPIDIQGTTFFVEKSGKALMGYVYDFNQSAYASSNASLLCDLINAPIGIDVDYNSSAEEGNYIYMVLDDGSAVIGCLVIDQSINAYTRLNTVNGDFKDVANVAGDTYFLVERDGVKYIEKLEDFNTSFKTDYTTEKTATAGVVSLLEDYEGETIYVYDSTQSYGSFTVSGGSVDTGESGITGGVFVGYPVQYELISNNIGVNGRTGSINKRISEATIETLNTNKITFNGQTRTNDDIYCFKGCSSPTRDLRYTISGEFYDIEVLSVELKISYGVR